MMEFTSYTKFALPRFQIVGALSLTLLKQTCIDHLYHKTLNSYLDIYRKKLYARIFMWFVYTYALLMSVCIKLIHVFTSTSLTI